MAESVEGKRSFEPTFVILKCRLDELFEFLFRALVLICLSSILDV